MTIYGDSKEIIKVKWSHKDECWPNKRDRHQRHHNRTQREGSHLLTTERCPGRSQASGIFILDSELGILAASDRPTPTMTVHMLTGAIKGKRILRVIKGTVLERMCLYRASGRRWFILSCHLSPKSLPVLPSAHSSNGEAGRPGVLDLGPQA